MATRKKSIPKAKALMPSNPKPAPKTKIVKVKVKKDVAMSVSVERIANANVLIEVRISHGNGARVERHFFSEGETKTFKEIV